MFNTTTEIIIALVCLALGYVARKWVEKIWPDEAAHVDSIGTKYGEAVQTEYKKLIIKAKAALDD